MRRYSWLLILLILLKLSWSTAAAMQLSTSPGRSLATALPPCHTSMEMVPKQQHQNHHESGHTAAVEVAAEQNPSSAPAPLLSHDTTCSDCQLCCAISLNVVNWSLPQAAPASAPRGLTQRWNSVSLRPELRPPLL